MIFTDLVGKLPVHPTKKIPKRSLSKLKRLIIHTSDWDIEPDALAKYDIGPNHISSTGCPSITYHWLVNKAGSLFKTADESWLLWHAGMHNSDTIAVSMLYKTDSQYEMGKKAIPDPTKVPTEAMMASTRDVLATLCLKFTIPPTQIFGHRELVGTGFIFSKGHKLLRKTCPGRAVDLDKLRVEVAKLVQVQLKDQGLYTGDIDGKWGPKSQTALTTLGAETAHRLS